MANKTGNNDRRGGSDAKRNPGSGAGQQGSASDGKRDQQSQQSGAMGQPGQGAGSNSTTSVGSSGNYGSGGQQGRPDASEQDKGADKSARPSRRGGI